MYKYKKTYNIAFDDIETMIRFERFLALLHHNSNFGHSGIFAMSLDGDGSEKIKLLSEDDSDPLDHYRTEVDLLSSIGGDIEIAYDDEYGCRDVNDQSSVNRYKVKDSALYKDGLFIRGDR